MYFNEFSMTISIENDITFVNESSQSSQVDYSFEKLRIVSNTYVENTKKKIYSQINNRNEIIFTSNIYAKNLAQTQVSDASEIQSSYMSTKFNTFDFTSNFLSFQFVWRNSRIFRIRMRNLIDVFAFESSKTKRNKRDKNVQNLIRIMNQRKISISNDFRFEWINTEWKQRIQTVWWVYVIVVLWICRYIFIDIDTNHNEKSIWKKKDWNHIENLHIKIETQRVTMKNLFEEEKTEILSKICI